MPNNSSLVLIRLNKKYINESKIMNRMKITLLWVSFASAILVWLPAGAWMYKGERGVVVAPTAPTAVYLTPKLGAVYVAPSTGYAHGVYGGSAAWNHSSGYAHGAYGGSAAWNHGSGVAYGAHGGSAAWSHGSGVAYGPHGGTAAWHR